MKLNFKKLTILTFSTLIVGAATCVSYNLSKNFNTNQYVENGSLTISNFTNIKMTYITDTKYKLTASVIPSKAAYNTVEWDLYWKNNSSTFSKGKDPYEYVSISQTSSDSLTIILECLQEFGETIVVRVTSVENNEAYATCDIDYGRKVKEVTAILNGESTNGQIITNNNLVELTANVTYNNIYTYNTLYEYTYELVPIENKTVDNQGARGTYYLSVANGYFETLLNTGKVFSYDELINYLDTNVESYGRIQFSYPYYDNIVWDDEREVSQDEFITQLNSIYFSFKVTVSDIYDTISCKFNCSPSVTAVSLSEDNIIF